MGLFKDLMIAAGSVLASEVGNEVKKFAKETYTGCLEHIDFMNRQLMRAAFRGNRSEVIELLNKGASVNAVRTASPLIAACMPGRTDIARLLIEKRADVNLVSSSGLSPLMWASGAKWLIEGVLERQDFTGPEDLVDVLRETHTVSAYRDHSDLVQLLLESGADVNARDYSFQFTPLIMACNAGNVNTVRLLLEHGADVNATDPDGVTPLYIACENDNSAIVRILLDNGANVNARAKDGRNPLIITCTVHNLATLRLWLGEDHVPMDVTDFDDHIRANNRHRVNVAKWLIDKGANVNAQTHNGMTALMSAAASGMPELVELLLASGADPTAVSIDGVTSAEVALACGFKDIERLLLSRMS